MNETPVPKQSVGDGDTIGQSVGMGEPIDSDVTEKYSIPQTVEKKEHTTSRKGKKFKKKHAKKSAKGKKFCKGPKKWQRLQNLP